mmetsp:Transcript_11734/g.28825  ORF Transcript_11734/g.28825 Transcript_11734/m.28825 type:complete len:246 (-) Transcript_11734:1006-1743(-)
MATTFVVPHQGLWRCCPTILPGTGRRTRTGRKGGGAEARKRGNRRTTRRRGGYRPPPCWPCSRDPRRSRRRPRKSKPGARAREASYGSKRRKNHRGGRPPDAPPGTTRREMTPTTPRRRPASRRPRPSATPPSPNTSGPTRSSRASICHGRRERRRRPGRSFPRTSRSTGAGASRGPGGGVRKIPWRRRIRLRAAAPTPKGSGARAPGADEHLLPPWSCEGRARSTRVVVQRNRARGAPRGGYRS